MSRRLRPTVPAVVLGLCLAVGGLAGCSADHSAVDQTAAGGQGYVEEAASSTGVIPVADRKPAPDLSGTDLDGAPLKLSTYAGKVIVLNVWASWCNPCRAEMPHMAQVAAANQAAGVQFLGVDIRDSRANAKNFAASQGVTYPSFFDQPGEIPARFDSLPPKTIPSTVVLDRHGRVAARFISAVLPEDLQPVLDRLVAET